MIGAKMTTKYQNDLSRKAKAPRWLHGFIGYRPCTLIFPHLDHSQMYECKICNLECASRNYLSASVAKAQTLAKYQHYQLTRVAFFFFNFSEGYGTHDCVLLGSMQLCQ